MPLSRLSIGLALALTVSAASFAQAQDAPQTTAQLQNLLRDGQPSHSITPQIMRDLAVSVLNLQDGGTVSGPTAFSNKLTFSGSGHPIMPTWGTAPETTAGAIGYNSTTGRWEFGIGGSVVNHVRLSGDTMTGQLNVGAATGNQVAIIPKASGTSPQIAATGTDPNLDLVLVTQGTGVVRTQSSNAGIFRASHLSISPGAFLTVSGNASETNSSLYGAISASGTCGTGDCSAYYLSIAGDTVDSSTAAGSIFSGFGLAQNIGAGAKGSHIGINVNLSLIGVSGNANGGAYVAGEFVCKTGSSDNGTSSNYAGGCFGLNPTAGITSSSVQYWDGLVGVETDVYAATGSKYRDMIGQQIVWTANGNQQPDRESMGLSINNQFAPSSTAGFKYGLIFGRYGGNFPVMTNGTIIYGEGPSGASFTVANGINWSLGTATSNWLNLGGKYIVDGSGNTYNAAKAHVGSMAAGTGMLQVDSTGATSASFNFISNNSAGTHIIVGRDDGRAGIGTATGSAINASLTVSDGGDTFPDAHIGVLQTTAPTVTNGSLDSKASDVSGTITISAANPVVTFHKAWNTTPHCVVGTPSGVSGVTYSVSTTALTITEAATSGTLSYVCVQ